MPTPLITGATGMVGRELLSRAVTDRRNERVFCLVRPKPDATAQQRLDRILKKVGHKRDPKRIIAVAGDCATEGLGLTSAARKRLGDVDRILHCAASVSFDLPIDEARAINVSGTRHMLDLARALPHLQRFDAVSTAYVAGCRQDHVMEADLAHNSGFHNTYEQTKHESERVLRHAMRDLPIAVHRPSIVVGDSKTGKTGAWKVLYWPLKVIARGFLPAIPFDPDARLDIVPVDFVADGILALADDPTAIGKTFHLCAGPQRDTTAGQLFERIFSRLGRRPPIQVRPTVWRNVVRPALMVAPSDKLKKTLTTGLVYRPYLELRLSFDTREADRRLHPIGVVCPKVLQYIDTIIDTALHTDFGRKAA